MSPFLLWPSQSMLCTAAKVILLKLRSDHVPSSAQNPLMTCPFTQNKSQCPYNHLRLLHGFFHYTFQLFSNVSFTVRLLLTTQFKIVKHPPSPRTSHFSSIFIYLFFSEELTNHTIAYHIFYLISFYCLTFPIKNELTENRAFSFFCFVPCCNLSI